MDNMLLSNTKNGLRIKTYEVTIIKRKCYVRRDIAFFTTFCAVLLAIIHSERLRLRAQGEVRAHHDEERGQPHRHRPALLRLQPGNSLRRPGTAELAGRLD